MVELFAKSGDPDQAPRSAAADLSACLPLTHLGVSSLQWVKSDIEMLTSKWRLLFKEGIGFFVDGPFCFCL